MTVLRQSMGLGEGRLAPRALYWQQGAEPAGDDLIVGLVDTPALAEALCRGFNALPEQARLEAVDGLAR